jgi:hypothetical protein
MCVYGILMDVISADLEVVCIPDTVVREASLPDGKFGGETMGEPSLDEADGAFERLRGVRSR